MKVRKGGGEEIPLVQGKEQWLCFAGAAVKRYPTSKVRSGGREELLHVRGQGRQPRGATPHPRPGAASEARGSGQEEKPHLQGAVAAWVQEGLEDQFHVQSQKGQR